MDEPESFETVEELLAAAGHDDDDDDDLVEAYRRQIEECRNDPSRAHLVAVFEAGLARAESEAAKEELRSEDEDPFERLARVAEVIVHGDLWPRLEAFGRLLHLLDEIEGSLVTEARLWEYPWSVIAAALGRSKQAVHARYASALRSAEGPGTPPDRGAGGGPRRGRPSP